ncbi:MAG: site-specific DNA-methyltransferase [Candidatus Lambdaproteobacteria bacterium]|nr:site-specific DNA-methyltransferase [Candidatus Lambdaproteobacteria bacterium]
MGIRVYETALGQQYCCDCLEYMAEMPAASVDLVLTSPPYALHFQKEYGNASQRNYVKWFLPYAHQIKRILKPTGSLVLNIGGAWTPGSPLRSLYQFRLLLSLCDEVGFRLAQEFFWHNPAKMPAPAEWVNVRRIRVKDSVEYIFWLSTTDDPKADNRKVLVPYSKDMERLIVRKISPTRRPSGHNITAKFSEDRGGAIPGNLIISGNNESNSNYIKASKESGKKIHPARFPAELPRFFIQLLTDQNDLVMDPFSGSNTTGAVAESLGRRWLSIEIDRKYAEDSGIRFEEAVSRDIAKADGRRKPARQMKLLNLDGQQSLIGDDETAAS